MVPSVSDEAPLLFCPFCREPYEDEERCPAHDLPLVAFTELPRIVRRPDEHERLDWFDPRFGRGIVALGASLVVLAFFAPWIADPDEILASRSGFQLALGELPRLWIVPGAAVLGIAALEKARTLANARRARLPAALLAVFGFAVAVYTMWYARLRLGGELDFAWGLIALGVSTALWTVGALRLGGSAPRD